MGTCDAKRRKERKGVESTRAREREGEIVEHLLVNTSVH